MAARSDIQNIFEPERHARPTKVELSFYADASPEAWQQAIEGLGYTLTRQSGDGPLRWNASFVALPENVVPGAFYLLGEVHPVDRVPGRTHWVLTTDLIPNPSPPSGILDSSRKVGGYPAVLERLEHAWPVPGQLRADTKVLYLLDPEVWASPFSLRKKRTRKVIRRGGVSAALSMEAYTWKIEPKGLLGSVSDLGGIEDAIALSVEGSCDLRVTSESIMEVERRTWQALVKFLQARAKRK